jgi:glycosyltransferase involved in cell wall biosynthesis
MASEALALHSKKMESRGFTVENPFPALGKLKKMIDVARVRRAIGLGQSNPPKLISIVIPAHNEEAYLQRTLDALKRQDYPLFEVIVVANGCKDRTAEVARNHCHQLIVLSQKGLGVARNLGARMAKGELLLFLDADTILEPGSLKGIAESFSQAHAAGTVQGRPDGERRAYRLIYFVKNSLHRWSLHHGSSGVIICWKDHFMRAGGFDEGLEMRENSELIRRLKRFGSYKYLGRIAATTSMRRYDQRGCGRIVWLWFKLWVQSLFMDLHQRPYETVR